MFKLFVFFLPFILVDLPCIDTLCCLLGKCTFGKFSAPNKHNRISPFLKTRNVFYSGKTLDSLCFFVSCKSCRLAGESHHTIVSLFLSKLNFNAIMCFTYRYSLSYIPFVRFVLDAKEIIQSSLQLFPGGLFHLLSSAFQGGHIEVGVDDCEVSFCFCRAIQLKEVFEEKKCPSY